jgi:tetratricopeptide (TPR) repeat protein
MAQQMQTIEEANTLFTTTRKRYLALNDELLRDAKLNPVAVCRLSKAGELGGMEHSLPGDATCNERDYVEVDTRLGEDAPFFRNPEPSLSKDLVHDVNSWVGEHQSSGLVIVFDRSERISAGLLSWFRESIFLELCDRVILLVAGQEPLDESWTDALRVGVSIELTPLTAGESRTLVQVLGIVDHDQQEWIIVASGGVPIFVYTLCQDMQRNPDLAKTDPTLITPPDLLMDRFLQQIPSEHRHLFVAGCILRSVTAENARSLLGEKDGGVLLELCKATPNVKNSPRGYVVHDRIRDYCNRRLRSTERGLFRDLSEKAAIFYGNASSGSFENITESIYHGLRADRVIGLQRLKEEFDVNALLNRSAECEELIDVAEQAGFKGDNWIELFRASVMRQKQHFAESKKMFADLLEKVSRSLDPELEALASYYYSVTAWYVCDFEPALHYARTAARILDELLSRSPGDARLTAYRNRAIGVRGLTLDRVGRFAEGCEEVEQMVAYSKKNHDLASLAYGLNSYGYFSYHTGNFRQSDAYLREARDVWTGLRNEFGACYPIGHRAALRAAIWDPRFDIAAIQKTVDLSCQTGNREMEAKCLQNLAWLLFRANKFEEANKAAEDAIQRAVSLEHMYYLVDSQRLNSMSMIGCQQIDKASALVEEALKQSEQMKTQYLSARLHGIRMVLSKAFIDVFRPAEYEEEFCQWASTSCSAGHGKAVSEYCFLLGHCKANRALPDPVRLRPSQMEAVWIIRASLTLNFHVVGDSLDSLEQLGFSQQDLAIVLRDALNWGVGSNVLEHAKKVIETAAEHSIFEEFNRARVIDLRERFEIAATVAVG